MSTASINVQNGKIPPALPAHMENKNLEQARRSTPDSDALLSSDDDHDHNRAMSMSMHSVKSLPVHRPARRSSWLSEVQPSPQRKFSLGGLSFTSSGSQPPTPSGESGGWDTSNNPSRNFPWNSQVWQKDRPARISEVMPSPTATFHDDLRSPGSREQQAAIAGGLPFDIPLEPNRKISRSQSYSAGQLEKSPGLESPSNASGHRMTKRGPLLRRTSRPSVLGMDGSGDYNLDSLQEDEVDEEEEEDAGSGVKLYEYNSPNSQKGQESLAPSVIARTGHSPLKAGLSQPPNISASNPPSVYSLPRKSPSMPINLESEYAVEDEDVVDAVFGSNRFVNRSASSITAPATSTADSNLSKTAAIENRRLEGVRRAQWQSSLGFGIPEEDSQSRRHSFATEFASRPRNPSLTQAFGPQGQPFGHQFGEEAFQRGQVTEEPYYTGSETKARHNTETDEYNNPFAVPNVFTRPVRILYIVSFKCSRSDIYYIPDNTGLQVQPGDMVVVEGDRGQDLGTVQRANVTLEEAKQLKQDFTKKHFQCLMMFSRLFPHVASAAANGEIPFPTTAVSPTATQASGPGKQGNATEAEPRPKMIKRVAKPDEIHLLREKEGNEAKAKRVCQSKVNEHGLRMEILDAEFQHDYRKLTFFYFAEEYINFNELVTDLFKVYKTRIWMSAINPASFPAPTAAPRTSMERRAANRAHDEYRLAVERGNAIAAANAMASGNNMPANAAPGIHSPNPINGGGLAGNEFGGNRMGAMDQGMLGGGMAGFGGSPPLSRAAAAAAGYQANIGGSTGNVALPSGGVGSEEFTHQQSQGSFDNRGLGGQMAATTNYAPYGGQQFGQTIPSNPWGQAGISTAIPYQFYPESRDMGTSAFSMGSPGAMSPGNVPRTGFGNPQQARAAASPSSAANEIQRQFQSLSLDGRRAS